MMKKFEFVAGTPKSDMIMGLCFPIGFMFPILLTYLLSFYSGMITYKVHPLFKFLVFLPAFVISYLGIDNRKISFILRPKEYKTITGATSFNPFGISDISDMSRLLTLGREVHELIEK